MYGISKNILVRLFNCDVGKITRSAENVFKMYKNI